MVDHSIFNFFFYSIHVHNIGSLVTSVPTDKPGNECYVRELTAHMILLAWSEYMLSRYIRISGRCMREGEEE